MGFNFRSLLGLLSLSFGLSACALSSTSKLASDENAHLNAPTAADKGPGVCILSLDFKDWKGERPLRVSELSPEEHFPIDPANFKSEVPEVLRRFNIYLRASRERDAEHERVELRISIASAGRQLLMPQEVALYRPIGDYKNDPENGLQIKGSVLVGFNPLFYRLQCSGRFDPNLKN